MQISKAKNVVMKRILLTFFALLSLAPIAAARDWQTIHSSYKIKGDLIAFNSEVVVIKKTNKELISIRLDELSKEDQDFLKSKESEKYLKSEAERVHTWTFKGGLKATGRVVDYGTRDVVILKRRNKILVNDRPFHTLPEVYKIIVRGIVSHFEQVTFENEKDLEKWLDGRSGKEAKYTCDGVLLELENGDEYAIPLFLFSDEDQAMLKPGWERWSKSKDDQAKSDHERFLLEAQTRAYQQEREQTHIQQLQLGMLAAASGLVWEVCIVPKPGVAAYPLCVAVPAQNSAEASSKVLLKYPAYTVSSARRVH